jgi:hypothetical protein
VSSQGWRLLPPPLLAEVLHNALRHKTPALLGAEAATSTVAMLSVRKSDRRDSVAFPRRVHPALGHQVVGHHRSNAQIRAVPPPGSRNRKSGLSATIRSSQASLCTAAIDRCRSGILGPAIEDLGWVASDPAYTRSTPEQILARELADYVCGSPGESRVSMCLGIVEFSASESRGRHCPRRETNQ